MEIEFRNHIFLTFMWNALKWFIQLSCCPMIYIIFDFEENGFPIYSPAPTTCIRRFHLPNDLWKLLCPSLRLFLSPWQLARWAPITPRSTPQNSYLNLPDDWAGHRSSQSSHHQDLLLSRVMLAVVIIFIILHCPRFIFFLQGLITYLFKNFFRPSFSSILPSKSSWFCIVRYCTLGTLILKFIIFISFLFTLFFKTSMDYFACPNPLYSSTCFPWAYFKTSLALFAYDF